MSADRHRKVELGLFLQACRGQITPADIGLPTYGKRVVRGLRREEVAQLAGVSHTWYTNIEQGRDVHPSSSVIDSLARALNLDTDAHDHLRRLAGLPVRPHPADADVDPIARDFVEAVNPMPSSVVSAMFDFVAINKAYEELFRVRLNELPPERRNVFFLMFNDEQRPPVDELAALRESLVEQLRFQSADHPDDERFKSLLESLLDESDDFRDLWPRHGNVRRSSYAYSVMTWRHPRVGIVRLRPLQLSLLTHPSHRASINVPMTAVDRHKLSLLMDDTEDEEITTPTTNHHRREPAESRSS